MRPFYFILLFAFLSLNANAQNTYVPDDNFEQALIDLGYDSGALDNYVLTANINSISYLAVQNKGISDLTGIEDFTALIGLYVSNNNLTSLDVSTNIELEYLTCANNSLTSLDLSNNIALIVLNVSNNNLSSLDVSVNIELEQLECYSNNLTNLDLSNNIALTYLSCHFNSLTTLDVTNNTALETVVCLSNNLIALDLSNNTSLKVLLANSNSLTRLKLTNNGLLETLNCSDNFLTGINLKNGNNTIITSFNALNNSDLECIQVEDQAYSTANWTNIDAQTSFSEDCLYPTNFTYVPDDNFEQALIDLGYDSGALDDYVLTTNINGINFLDVKNKAISDLTGIEDFTALTILNVSSNNITSLDVSNSASLFYLLCHSNSLTNLDISNNIALKNLSCGINNLTSLDVNNNTALKYLSCLSNNLTHLNLANNPVLKILNCDDNELIGLNLKNGNNTKITYFNALNNSDLECIQVDDAVYSAANWINVDPSSMFSEDCQYKRTSRNRNQQALMDSKNDSFSNNEVMLYPNPVNDVITVSIQADAYYTIHNINGQQLLDGKLKGGENRLNLSQLKTGLYILNIVKDGISVSKKLIKN
ncbi:T9SS type A sorting domain-containing protein [Psychroserpens ponticola]|uniref:T9SS type A sorting domain-containing protein n=1 Tax=Psychroserpens ponticola TaxID=2932268 RepID=A0ABY7RXA8_9FLAO|nr:T9SS type A sorting domain-containing protein [Psychroserpens ponticola]WCO01397.1 T9SS type A sorting domain-containing protein [Psychroserpens ponticola]